MKIPEWFNNLPEKGRKKLKKDIFYFSMIKNGCSYIDLLNSGWLSTNYSLEENIINSSVFSTNLPYDAHISKKEELCILLNTGSYAPAHKGHIEMMLAAKKEIEKNGHKIDAIIFSPSHDSYVLNKSEDIKTWNIEKRINSLITEINDYEYENDLDRNLFTIDLWESIYSNTPINFTDVIFKIEKNIKKHLNKTVKIFYVFGSDNEKFMDCFSNLPNKYNKKYFGVCIERKDYKIINKKSSINTFYSENKKHAQEKSREIRKTKISNKVENINNNNLIYCVRLDSALALEKWIIKYPKKEEILKKSYFKFHEQLKKNIELTLNLKTITIDVEKQIKLISEINNFNIINLDNCSNNRINNFKLDFSRLFIVNDLQIKPLKMIKRHELDINNINIPEGNYILVDDDIASGNTVKIVKGQLKNININIVKEYSLLNMFLLSENINDKIFDIIDTRDFLLGSNEGGLFCQIGNKAIRMPYLSPWVNLKTRAKLNFEQIKSFNIYNLKSLKDFFEENKYLTFKDLSPDLQLFYKNNFKSLSINTCIDKHIEWISKNMN